jgi:serine/threonine-protein kinase
MGTVHEVFDAFLWRTVAAKFVRMDVNDQNERTARSLEEARITAQLDHPNVIPVYDLGLDASRGVFFCMKLLQGRSLLELVTDAHKEPLTRSSLRRLLTIVLRVCDALSFAHGRSVIHRDVKPDNVLVGTHGQVYLTDWGVALLKARSATSTSTEAAVQVPSNEHLEDSDRSFAGTVAYMAPEQTDGEVSRIDERTDVYGVGGILHHLLTGRAPHDDRNPLLALEKARKGRLPPLDGHGVWPELPPGLVEITRKALAPVAADRYQTVEELANELTRFLDGGGWFATQEFAPGTVIVAEGAPGHTAYLIVEGTCQVTKLVRGEQTAVRELRPGDVFGEMAVLGNQVRTASVTAKDRVVVKVVTRESLDSELSGSPILGTFMKALVDRFIDLEKRTMEKP